MKHESSTPTPQERASHPGTYNGLAAWRAQQAAEKQRKMDALAEHRKQATTEVRDGREFTVLRLPDRYDFTAKPKTPVQLHGAKRKQFAA